MKFWIYIFTSSFLLFSCATTRSNYATQSRSLLNGSEFPPAVKDGQCYMKYIAPEKTITQTKKIYVYIGDEDLEEVDIKYENIEISPAESKWEKKVLENCVSKNPNDCIVACLVETPAKYEVFKILQDTSQSSNFKTVEIQNEILISKGGEVEWVNIVCANDLTHSLKTKIQIELKARGYYQGEISGELNTATFDALKNFQKENQLRIGLLDLDSISKLGIKL